MTSKKNAYMLSKDAISLSEYSQCRVGLICGFGTQVYRGLTVLFWVAKGI
jgi:hypothetical protein